MPFMLCIICILYCVAVPCSIISTMQFASILHGLGPALSSCSQEGKTALFIAVEKLKTALVNVLLANKANVDAEEKVAS